MKTTISLFLLFGLMFASCGEQKKSAKDELYDKVMAVHDEIMPKMGAIMKYKKQLNEKLDKLTEEGADANAEKIAELTKAVTDLESSHKEMMNWMHGFDSDFDGMVKEEVMKYLKDQEKKIESVAKITNNALKNAEELLVLGKLNLNSIDDLKLNLPCELEMVYNENLKKSYVCQTLENNIPVSYRVTIENFKETLQEFDEKEKRVFNETYLDKIKSNAKTESKNIKTSTFHNLPAIQFDDFVKIEDVAFQARTFIFLFNEQSISFNFVSNTDDFDKKFDEFLADIELIR